MSSRISRSVAVLAVATFAFTLHAQSNFSGVWKGTITESLPCSGGGSVISTFDMTLTLQQSGSALSGNAVAVGKKDACVAGSPTETVSVAVSGTAGASGTTASGTWSAQGGSGPFSVSLNSPSSLVLTFTFPDGVSASGTLTRTGDTPSSSDFSGTWSGTFHETTQQSGCPSLDFTGTSAIVVVQTGSTVSGTYAQSASERFPGANDTGCLVIGGPTGGSFTGAVSGNTAVLTAVDAEAQVSGSFMVNGSTMTGHVNGGNFMIDFTLTRASSVPPPSDATGTYVGSYTYEISARSNDPAHPGCTNLGGTYTSSGVGTLAFTQAGSSGSASLAFRNATDIVDDGKGNCSVVVHDLSGTFPVVKNGAAWTGSTGEGGGLNLVFSGDTVSIYAPSRSSTGTMTARRTSTSVQPTSCTPVLTAPPVSQSGVSYSVYWSAVSNSQTTYVIDESTSSDFSSGVTSTTVNGTSTTFVHTVTSSTTYYYRVRATTCNGAPGPNAPSTYTVVQAPPPPASTKGTDTVLPFGTSADYSFPLFVPAPAGKAATLDTGFTASTDQTFLKVNPASGTIPPTGTTLTVTVSPLGLPPGANTGTVTVTPASGAATNTPVTVSLVTPVSPGGKSAPPPDALIIPVVTHVNSGSGPFQSDVRLTNAGALSTLYQLAFTPTRTDGTQSGKLTSVAVAPGQTIAFNDIARDFFGYGATGAVADSGFGTLEIRPSNASSLLTYASSRTFVTGASGTYGQFIAAIPVSKFAGPGSVLSLQQVAQSSKFRTNLGITEGSGAPASGRIRVIDDSGKVLAEVPYALGPDEHQQLNQFIASPGGVASLDDGRIEITVDSATGAITAYASVLDNVTADPLAVTPVNVSQVKASRYVVPGMAEFVSAFSNFHSDMRVYNGGTAAAVVTPTYYPQGGAAPVSAAPVTILPGHVQAYDNVLPTLFNVSSGGGSVLLATSGDTSLVASGRTYSFDGKGGTFGQFIPGVTPAEGIGAGDRPLQVLQLEESAQFRSNVGLTELTGNPAQVRITIVPPDSRVSAVVTATLAPNEFRQFGKIIESAYGAGVKMYNARVSVEVTGGTGRVAAYGSVIDNGSLDPTYVPAQ